MNVTKLVAFIAPKTHDCTHRTLFFYFCRDCHAMTPFYYRRHMLVLVVHEILHLLLLPCAVHPLLTPRNMQIARSKHAIEKRRRMQFLESNYSTQHLLDLKSTLYSAIENEDQPQQSKFKQRHILLQSYAFHWTALLQREYQESLNDLQLRRKSYTRKQLEESGLTIPSAVATTETELYGEKIVRVTLPDFLYRPMSDEEEGSKKLQDRFKRGDALSLSPLMTFRGKEILPREGLVMEVGKDYLTLGVGSSWPSGLMEMRKYDTYLVRLDRSLSNTPLKAQEASLEQLRRGEGGDVADLLVELFYREPSALDKANEKISDQYFDLGSNASLEKQVEDALEQAMKGAKFVPNFSQQEAIVWALRRKIALIRGPPGTGDVKINIMCYYLLHNYDKYFRTFPLLLFWNRQNSR